MKANSSDAKFAAVTKPNLGNSATQTKRQVYHDALDAARQKDRLTEQQAFDRMRGDIDSGRRARFGAAKAGKVAVNNKVREELGLPIY